MAPNPTNRQRRRWQRVEDGIDGFFSSVKVGKWKRTLNVVIFRKRVMHPTRKNYQLDLFEPDNGTWEYSALATNLPFDAKSLWRFMSGRGLHEKAIGELKTGLAFDAIPTDDYRANSVWQQFVVLAHNLLANFQIESGLIKRPPTAFAFNGESDGHDCEACPSGAKSLLLEVPGHVLQNTSEIHDHFMLRFLKVGNRVVPTTLCKRLQPMCQIVPSVLYIIQLYALICVPVHYARKSVLISKLTYLAPVDVATSDPRPELDLDYVIWEIFQKLKNLLRTHVLESLMPFV